MTIELKQAMDELRDVVWRTDTFPHYHSGRVRASSARTILAALEAADATRAKLAEAERTALRYYAADGSFVEMESAEAVVRARVEAARKLAEAEDSVRDGFECFDMIRGTLEAHGVDCKNTPPMFINDAVHNALAAKNRALAAVQAKLAEAEADRDGYRNGQQQVQATLLGVMDANTKWARDAAAAQAEASALRELLAQHRSLPISMPTVGASDETIAAYCCKVDDWEARRNTLLSAAPGSRDALRAAGLQIAGAVWAHVAPSVEMDANACARIVDECVGVK